MDVRGDLKLAVRGLRRQAGLAVTILFTLALGIGATTAVFTVVNAVVLAPLPYAEPERLVRVYSAFPAMKLERFALSPPEFLELKEGLKSFSSLAVWATDAANVADGSSPVRAQTALTSGQLLTLMGVSPSFGRLYGDAATLPGAPPVALLGHGLWTRDFGADPRIVGRMVRIDGVPTEVVGVMPKGFAFPTSTTELWMPLTIDPADRSARSSHFLSLVGRLRPDATLPQAQAELKAFMVAHNQDHQGQHRFDGTRHLVFAVDLRDDVVGDARGKMLLLLGATGFVLLIACANVAGLLLARAGTRERDVAVQAALGASRRRLVQQLLTESVLIALAGGGLGVLVARLALRGILAMDPDSVPRAAEVTLSAPVLVFALVASALTGLLFGLIPSLAASRPDLVEALKAGGRTTSHRGALRFRRLLVVAEVALAVVLVVGAGLLVRSFGHLLAVEPGFAPERLLTFELALPQALYAKDADVVGFYERLEDRLRSLPGVEGVTLAAGLPPSRPINANDIEFEGKVKTMDGPIWNVDYWQTAGRHYFETLKIPVREGRALDDRDGPEAPPVVVVNEAMARKFWPGESPVGRRVKSTPGREGPLATVVGVVGDVKQAGLDQEAGTEMYFSLAQPALTGGAFRSMSVVLRSQGRDPLSLLPSVRAVVGELDGALPLAHVRTMEELIGASLVRTRFLMTLLASFAGLALVLAAVGIYGLLSHVVAQRTSEIGLRMALGANRGLILRGVVGYGLGLVGLGIGLGLVGALALSRLMGSLVFGIGATDPLTFAGVALILFAVALMACLLPAGRAVRVDPVVALRYE
ncbi:MAG TPA: ABC transporter permease [Vicinamibacteria bacterium]|nr:ABC transporter permease [Vicinamibacteria bacterium]